MAKTEFVYVQGKAKWFRHTTLNPWGKWAHTLYPNAESLEKIRELQAEGMKNVIKKDEDGYYVVFNRPSSKEFKGKVQGFAPPEVLGPDGMPLRDILVGNGSDVTTKLEVYKHKTPGGGEAKAARWLSTRIDNLIPFVVNRDFDENQERAVKDLEKQPEQLF